MENKVKISTQNLNLYYGENHALKNVNMDIRENAITAFIGPSGCGKSTFLKTLNRMNDLVDCVRIEGTVKLDEIVEESLRGAAIFDEVKDRLKKSALGLSGGQQQRICIARALAVQPEVLLMDEPTSALDPISTSKIEDLMEELKKKYTVVVVTHNMQQAVRVSDYTAFFLVGEMMEFADTKQLFAYPQDKRTEDYITGRFG